ncbi:glycosyl hydrolase family 18 protein [Caldanaerobius polysaccharolyticus]|uniref:glycosyl hydrolase family 18 protein n=1 Tax=Caldanaerobius polysaccharolyticus TaxID=44256 RepID=UPI000478C53C|nr:glycosyl hydrolase family 18 protein [Caldanaerobius polysaccharolyticus]
MDNIWFYVSSPDAKQDLSEHGNLIDKLVPYWYGVKADGTLDDQAEKDVKETEAQKNIQVYPIIHNYSSPQMRDRIHNLLSNPQLRSTLVTNIVNMAVGEKYPGVNIDFEFVPPEDRQNLTTFMQMLYTELSGKGIKTTISVPAELKDNPDHPFSGAFNYSAIQRFCDEMYILAYDEHFATPGPIASIGFVRNVLNYAVTVIPPNKIRLGMAVYGYDWTENVTIPRTLSYNQAIELARNLGANITYDETAQESTFTYTMNTTSHTVWFEDVRSFTAKLELLMEYNIPGIAVWRLGQEDQRIWNILAIRNF